MRPALWICLPTYNEAENLERMIHALGAEFTAHDLDGHVLVIDDGSPDGTGEIADRLAAELPWLAVLHRTEKQGLGRAYLAGFAEVLARGADLVMEMDCDFSHDPGDVHRLVAAVSGGDADFAIGSRYVHGGRVTDWPLLRRFIPRSASLYARTILGVKVRDCTAGFKCFRRTVLERLDLSHIAAQGYTFQIEVTYRALQSGFTVREVPVTFTDRELGKSKMSSNIVLEAMLLVWKMRLSKPAPLRDPS